MNVKALDSLIKYQKDLNKEKCKIIYNFFINLPIDKFNEMTSLNEQMNFIPAFLLKSIKEKIIEIEAFYKDIIEVNGMINIFNFLCTFENFKTNKYYVDSTKNFDKFLQLIEENEIIFSQLVSLNDLIEKPIFQEKLVYYNFNEREKNFFSSKIHSIYNNILEKKKKLEECQKYLEQFPSAEDSKQKNMIISKTKKYDYFKN